MTKSTVNEKFDIAIVGGGLAGSSMAVTLRDLAQNRNLNIAIIEAVPFDLPKQPSFDDRALALSYGSKCIFETLGIWELMEDIATPIKHIHVSDKGHVGFARMHAEEVNVNALGYVITARNLGMVLKQFNQCSAVTTISPAQVEKIQAGEQYAELQLKIKGKKKTQVLKASLVILADGGRSGLAQQLGIKSSTHDYQQQAVLANVQCSQPHENIAYERFTKNGPVALLPMKQDVYKLVCTVSMEQQEEIMALPDDEFLQYIQKWFGDRAGRFVRVGKRATYPMKEVSTDNITFSRVALIGNAAHAMHPIAGQGFNLGLRDAAELAELISSAVLRQQDIGSQQLLSAYKRNRNQDIQSMMKFTDSLVRFFSNNITPITLFRNAGLLMVDRVPFIKKQLMRKMMGLSGRQTKLMRGILPGDETQSTDIKVQHAKS